MQVGKMKADRPKLYGLILKNLSLESQGEVTQEPDYYKVWHNVTDPEKLWQAIKEDCVSNANQVKELTAKKAYQMIKQGPFESSARYSKRFSETYQSYKNSANAQAPVNIVEEEQAMDFFHGFDNGRYSVFKTNMLNGCGQEELLTYLIQ